jgi:hypothetical protein
MDGARMGGRRGSCRVLAGNLRDRENCGRRMLGFEFNIKMAR